MRAEFRWELAFLAINILNLTLKITKVRAL